MILHLLIASGGDVHPLLDPHKFGLVFWTGVTFMIVLAILYKKAWGPLLAALDAREQGIAGQKTAADKLRADAEALRAKYEAQLEGIRREAQQIISEGEQDKKRILDDAHKAAVLDAQAVKERGERDIQLAKSKALAELKKDAVNLGMAIAEKVIAAEVDAARHRAVVDDVISSYERR